MGAWTWLPDRGFGVATEMDYDEAFRSLLALRFAYIVLFSLLVFMLQPIARLCRVEGSVVGAAAPWMALGALLSLVKLAAVM